MREKWAKDSKGDFISRQHVGSISEQMSCEITSLHFNEVCKEDKNEMKIQIKRSQRPVGD